MRRIFFKFRLSHLSLFAVLAVTLLIFYNSQVLREKPNAKATTLRNDEIEDRMQQRLSRVQDVCNKYGIFPEARVSQYRITHPPAPQYSVFYFDRQNRLAYCPLYKSASTSMLHWLLKLKGVTETEIRSSKSQISEIARRYYPSQDYPAAEKMLEESQKLLIVRHPLERLLSAYRDKLENASIGHEHGTWHYYEKYGRSIVSKYRKEEISRLEPTFEEFINYVIDTNLMHYADDHWIPYYLFCTPCLVNYDVVAKFETLDEDLKMFLEKSNLVEQEIPGLKHVTHGGKSKEKLAKYFSSLTSETILKLYEKFKFDFELFDYNIDEILSYVKTK